MLISISPRLHSFVHHDRGYFRGTNLKHIWNCILILASSFHSNTSLWTLTLFIFDGILCGLFFKFREHGLSLFEMFSRQNGYYFPRHVIDLWMPIQEVVTRGMCFWSKLHAIQKVFWWNICHVEEFSFRMAEYLSDYWNNAARGCVLHVCCCSRYLLLLRVSSSTQGGCCSLTTFATDAFSVLFL